MSVPVALDELARRFEEFGPHPLLVTASADRRAHVVSVTASFDGERFSFTVGRTSRANLDGAGSVTLVWPGSGGPYMLIVDGSAGHDDEHAPVTLTPTRAVLHRVAGAPADVPSCVAIEAAG